jgi:hypothetical protein
LTFTLASKEMDKLVHLWEFHRNGVNFCKHKGDVKINFLSSGIGTAVVATCACGKDMDITDYHSW